MQTLEVWFAVDPDDHSRYATAPTRAKAIEVYGCEIAFGDMLVFAKAIEIPETAELVTDEDPEDEFDFENEVAR